MKLQRFFKRKPFSLDPCVSNFPILNEPRTENRQQRINELFSPRNEKPKRQWIRPDRPGAWGERRDGQVIENEMHNNQFSSIHHKSSFQVRRTKSEFVLPSSHSLHQAYSSNSNANARFSNSVQSSARDEYSKEELLSRRTSMRF